MKKDVDEASVQSVVHTPGPWDAISHDFGRTKVWEVVAGPKADTVVELSLFSQNAEADAKLIAAAPMMLAACMDVAKTMEDTQIYAPELAILRAAIRQAVGEQV